MKRKHIYTLITTCAIVLLSSCTENERAKSYGGTQTINLQAKTKLVNVTWKEGSSMWILTRPMREDETPETLTFTEKSGFGLVEGKVIINESK